MQKLENVDIAESNIAMLGSDLELEVRKAAAESAEEWKGCGQTPGVEIWRIEKFQVKKWPKKEYGNFFDGDSYIVLHTYKPDPKQDKLAWNVHFWLGQNTSQDEAGTAAYKTVELDDLLGTLPVQFREVQGHESNEFLQLFEPSINVLTGGVESGFNIVKPEEYKPRLLQMKGKGKNVAVMQVELSRDSLNEGDVFILDAGLDVVVWSGSSAHAFEKRKATEVLNAIKDQRNGKVQGVFIDGQEDCEIFWSNLGGKGDVKDAAAGGDDASAEDPKTHLVRLSDAGGKLELTEVRQTLGKLDWSELSSDDVFIIATSTTVYIWVGGGASKEERGQAFQHANDYLVEKGLPFTTSVVRVMQASHNKHLESFFEGPKPAEWCS